MRRTANRELSMTVMQQPAIMLVDLADTLARCNVAYSSMLSWLDTHHAVGDLHLD
jgi:hypothetical protein